MVACSSLQDSNAQRDRESWWENCTETAKTEGFSTAALFPRSRPPYFPLTLFSPRSYYLRAWHSQAMHTQSWFQKLFFSRGAECLGVGYT